MVTVEQEVVTSFKELFFFDVCLSDNISELAVDSLDLLSLQQLLEQKFDISLPDKMFSTRDITVLSIVERVKKALDVRK